MQLVHQNHVKDSFVCTIDRFHDERGFFQEIYSFAKEKYYPFECKQINVSSSKRNTIRGLHVVPFAKMCACVRGSLFDIVADVRRDSPTYLKWFGTWLTEENRNQMYIPPGCAHGFFAAEDDTLLLYSQSATYSPGVEQEVNWADPSLGIAWPLAEKYIISDKDSQAPNLVL